MPRSRALVVVLGCLTAGCAPATGSPAVDRVAATPASPTDDCRVASVDYQPSSRTSTVAYALSRIPKVATISIVDIVDIVAAGPARYATESGARPKRTDPLPFSIYTPWTTIPSRTLFGTPAETLYTEGGTIGCDALLHKLTWSMEPGTRALVVSGPPLDLPAPAGWQMVMWSWQIAGDTLIVPQPPETVGPEFTSRPHRNLRYDGKTQDGAAIPLTEIEQYLRQTWRPRGDND